MNLFRISAVMAATAVLAMLLAVSSPSAMGEGRVGHEAQEDAQAAVLFVGDTSMYVEGDVIDFGEGFWLVVGDESLVRITQTSDDVLFMEDMVGGEKMAVLMHNIRASDAIQYTLGRKPQAPDDTPQGKCREQAEAACGEDKICWVLVVAPSPNVGEVCAYMCQDGQGDCPPMPSPFKKDMISGLALEVE